MGCGCSSSSKVSTPIPVTQETQKPVERLPSPIPPPSPSSISVKKCSPKFKRGQLPKKIYEDFIVVWLNPSANDDDPTVKETEEQLQELVNVVITYADPNDCETFIENIKDEKIFLVVSGTTVEEFVPKVQAAPQIDSIYCLSSEQEEKKIKEANIPGLNGTYTTARSLYDQMKDYQKIARHNLIKPIVVENDPARNLYMYDQLFKDVILNSEEEEGNMEELYKFCETHSSKDKGEQKYLFKFKKYKPEKSIKWYTREFCLYKVLNRALRLHEYEKLYELRVFIRHLHGQLSIQRGSMLGETPTLYRGQMMEIEEFEVICKNKGKYMFFANFLSTSDNNDQAMSFVTRSIDNPKNKNKVKVLFEIKVDKNIDFCFAGIRQLSAHPEEDEWLFSLGSVFRINAIERQANNVELIRLTLMDHNDEQLAPLREHLQSLVNDKNICLNFARLMHQMGNWEGSKEFYEKRLDNENEYSRKAAIYNNLGSIALELGKYDEALKKYKQSLKTEQKKKNFKHRDLTSTYNNIGTTNFKKNEMDAAIENFKQAIVAYNEEPNGDQELIATIYNNIAVVLNYQDRHQQALVNNRRCLTIRERILPPLHPSLAIAYNSIATTYYCLGFASQDEKYVSQEHEYAQKAVDYAVKAVNIDRQALPSNHPQTKLHEGNLERFLNAQANIEQSSTI